MNTPITQNSISPNRLPSATSSPAPAVGTVAGDVVLTVAGFVVVAFVKMVVLALGEVKDVENDGPRVPVSFRSHERRLPPFLSELEDPYQVQRWTC